MCVLSGQTKTPHILSNTISPCPSQTEEEEEEDGEGRRGKVIP